MATFCGHASLKIALLILFCLLISTSSGDESNEPSDVAHMILNVVYSDFTFHKNIRPTKQLIEPITVHMGAALNQIISLDEHNQVLVTNLWMRFVWNDPFLVWDPDDFNGTTHLHLPADLIWKPDVVLYNNADKQFIPTFNNVIIDLHNDGDIICNYPAVAKTSCEMNIKYFPFDQQICKIKFGSWSHDGSKLNLTLKPNMAADYRNFEYNSEWSLVSFIAEHSVEYYDDLPFPSVTFYIKLRRRWTLHFFYLLMPNLLINITAITQFLLPCDSGEKVTLSITIYLSMVVYLLIMQEILPSSEDIPVIVKYIVTTMVLVSFSQTLNIVVLQLHHNGIHDNHRRLPLWLRKIFLHGIAKLLCMHRYIVPDEIHEIKLSQHVSNLSLIPENLKDDHDDASESSEQELFNEATIEPTITIQEEYSPDKVKHSTNQITPTDKDINSFSKIKYGGLMPSHFFTETESKRRSSVRIIGEPKKSITTIQRGDLKKNKELLLYKLLKIGEDHTDRVLETEAEAEILCEWQQLAMVIDRLMFFLYMFITFIVWVVMISAIPTYEEDVIL